MPSRNIGIDLGTTSVIFYTKEEGLLLQEPAVVAFDTHRNAVLAVGETANKMLGRTPAHIIASYPMAGGVISDYAMTQEIIKQLLGRIGQAGLVKPRVNICVPTHITGVEEDAVTEAALEAGARQVYLIDEPIAAAIGAGLNILAPKGHMVVDIGGGTTDIAVISMGGTVVSTSIKKAGNSIDEEIVKYLRTHHQIVVGQQMVKTLKKEVGCATPKLKYNSSCDIKGRSMVNGLPMRLTIETKDLYEPINLCIEQIFVAIRNVLESTPPELAGDIFSEGILLTGGGAQLTGMAEYLQLKTKVPVHVAANPELCVAIGAGLAFELEGKLESGFREVKR